LQGGILRVLFFECLLLASTVMFKFSLLVLATERQVQTYYPHYRTNNADYFTYAPLLAATEYEYSGKQEGRYCYDYCYNSHKYIMPRNRLRLKCQTS
jgi:hypothetical protein